MYAELVAGRTGRTNENLPCAGARRARPGSAIRARAGCHRGGRNASQVWPTVSAGPRCLRRSTTSATCCPVPRNAILIPDGDVKITLAETPRWSPSARRGMRYDDRRSAQTLQGWEALGTCAAMIGALWVPCGCRPLPRFFCAICAWAVLHLKGQKDSAPCYSRSAPSSLLSWLLELAGILRAGSPGPTVLR
jgi:hypothetical protein